MSSGVADEVVVLVDGLSDGLLVLEVLLQVVGDGLARSLEVSKRILGFLDNKLNYRYSLTISL